LRLARDIKHQSGGPREGPARIAIKCVYEPESLTSVQSPFLISSSRKALKSRPK